MFKKFLLSVLLVSVAMTVTAKEYKFIIPNPPGSSSDIVARAIADEFQRLTGDVLVLNYHPGGDHIIAASKFKNEKKLSVSLGTTTMHVFNYATKEKLPYSESDFVHVGWIGWSPHVWYTKANGKFKTIQDVERALLQKEPINVAVDAMSTQANVLSLQKFHKNKGNGINMIKYKGSPESLAAVLGDQIDLANSSISPAIIENAQAGKIIILGTTHKSPLRIEGLPIIPRSSEIFKVKQFNGGFLVSLSPGFEGNDEFTKLKSNLLKTIQSAHVKELLSKILIEVDPMDEKTTTELLRDYKDSVKILIN